MSINHKAPFRSSNVRFDKPLESLAPGPGSYEPRLNVLFHIILNILSKYLQLRDKVIDKIRFGYRGNFGTTDRRFKIYNIVDVIL